MKLAVLILLLTVVCMPTSAFSYTTVTGTDILNIYGVDDHIEAYDYSIITTYPESSIATLYVYDNSTVNIHGGNISHLDIYNSSHATIDDGNISFLSCYDNSKAEISYAEVLDWLIVSDYSEVNIYGTSFSYSMGILSGIWSNGEEFSFWAIRKIDIESGNIGNTLPGNIHLHNTSSTKHLSSGILQLLLSQ